MILDAEQRGLLKPGDTIVEPTSGNTGIGLAQVAAARGYQAHSLPAVAMSEERKRTLLAYGAELVLTDPELRMLAAIEEAKKIRDGPARGCRISSRIRRIRAIHYETTGPELWEAMDGRIDAFVYGSGTGGTISGVGRFLKERRAETLVVAVEPARSPVLSGGERGQHQFQGMGPGFVPANFDRTVVDRVIQAWEEDAFPLARRLAREERALRRHVERRDRVGVAADRARARPRAPRRDDLARFRGALSHDDAVRRRVGGNLKTVKRAA